MFKRIDLSENCEEPTIERYQKLPELVAPTLEVSKVIVDGREMFLYEIAFYRHESYFFWAHPENLTTNEIRIRSDGALVTFPETYLTPDHLRKLGFIELSPKALVLNGGDE